MSYIQRYRNIGIFNNRLQFKAIKASNEHTGKRLIIQVNIWLYQIIEKYTYEKMPRWYLLNILKSI